VVQPPADAGALVVRMRLRVAVLRERIIHQLVLQIASVMGR